MGAVGGILPNLLPNLAVWLDAADQAGINSGGITADGTAVSTWKNKTGLGNFTAATTKRPLYKTNIQNGLPALLFDGTDDRMLSGAISALQTPRITIFCVFKPTTATPATSNVVVSANYAAQDNMYNIFFTASNTYAFIFRTSGAGTTTITGLTTNCVVASSVNRSGSAKYKIDAIRNPAIVNMTADFDASTHLSVLLGCRNQGSDDLFFAGHLMEVIIYAAALTDADQAGVVYYLKSKWGL